MRLQPANDIVVDGDVYESIGVDPSFILSSDHNTLPGGLCEFSYRIKNSTIMLRPVLYVDTGEGFQQETLIALQVAGPGNFEPIRQPIRLPWRLRGLRLDPAVSTGRFVITDVTILEIGYLRQLARAAFRDWNSFWQFFISLLTKGIAATTADVLADQLRARDDWGYASWVKVHDTLRDEDCRAIVADIATFTAHPRFLLLLNADRTSEAALRRTVDSILAQLYPQWHVEAHGSSDLVGSTSLAARQQTAWRLRANRQPAEALDPDVFVARVNAGDVLAPHALYLLAKALIARPGVQLIYSDEDRLDQDGFRCEPHFKADWSQDLLLGGEAIGRLYAIRSDLAKAVRLCGPAEDYEVMLRAAERIPPAHIHHIPEVLYHRAAEHPDQSPAEVRRSVTRHLARSGVPAGVVPAGEKGNFSRIRYPLPNPLPLVSLIIPTRDRVDLLRQCMQGLIENTEYPRLEVLIVDNGSIAEATLAYFEELKRERSVRILNYPRPFNYAAINNFAVKQAGGEIIGLLNNDIKVIHSDWLTEMVAHAARPAVGAVGAKLYYENDTIQHAGLVTGVHGVAGHVFRGFARNDDGYFGRLWMVQERTCVTAACMVMPRRVYLQAGGMDETNLPISFNDVDLCMRIRELGYRVIWTPFAELYHLESASRGSDTLAENRGRALREFDYMRARWAPQLDRDPFYNPNLAFETEDFGLAFPPRTPKPWRKGDTGPSGAVRR